MGKYQLTNKAVDDLTEIWDYTLGQWSEQQAEKYYLMLIEHCEEIANKPEIGKNYEEITPNLFGLRVGRHIIFFRKINSQIIEITRILHERMDLKNRILE